MENICIYSYHIEKVRIKNFTEILDKNELNTFLKNKMIIIQKSKILTFFEN
jgi:hypothetical protein